ncbi:formate dehydrogenase delta subunit [Pseudonocardia thermophila]|uniref:Formate dehydrogenase delta subunit n=1 Tax=Pseudonocardia thermophila TaxID=1848 RepID=A0A1M6Z6Z3_PSETH|nr:formate dehydrogenase subunit delta [Pseudonocardia thermophila]SHL26228.1 formate dehydrogenase delta subunit [Pseudonocardia thermophila]
MTGTVPPPVRLAGDIAAQFRHKPLDQAAAAVAEHIRMFWEPRMRRALLAEVDAGTVTDPVVVAAAQRLRGGG